MKPVGLGPQGTSRRFGCVPAWQDERPEPWSVALGTTLGDTVALAVRRLRRDQSAADLRAAGSGGRGPA